MRIYAKFTGKQIPDFDTFPGPVRYSKRKRSRCLFKDNQIRAFTRIYFYSFFHLLNRFGRLFAWGCVIWANEELLIMLWYAYMVKNGGKKPVWSAGAFRTWLSLVERLLSWGTLENGIGRAGILVSYSITQTIVKSPVFNSSYDSNILLS